PGEIVTAVVGAAAFLREEHPGARCFLLSDGDATEDLEGVRLVEDDPDVVVIGGASDDFSYRNVDRVFRMLVGGASLVAMHRNLYWGTFDGLQLDAGAYVRGAEPRHRLHRGPPRAAGRVVGLRIASSRTDLARNLFAGIAPEYDRMGRIMSFGQDGRWRRFLVSRIALRRAAWSSTSRRGRV